MKEIENDTNKWEDILMEGRINIVKMSILPTARFNSIPIKIMMAFSEN